LAAPLGPSAAAEESWYPSQYGAADTIGAANTLSPDIIRQAVTLVTRGKVYSLAIDTGPDTPQIRERDYKVVVVQRKIPTTNRLTSHDDMVIAWQGVGTQLDGLGHAGIDSRYYNGIHADDFYAVDGVKKLSIHQVPPIVTRGVLLDMARYYGVDRVAQGAVFNRAQIEGAAKQQGVEIRKGDVVLLHTGWLDLMHTDRKKFLSGNPGLGKEGARYLANRGVVAVGADSQAVEVLPAEVSGEFAPVHQILLAQSGVYLLEYIDARGLIADGVSEFLFVLGQPRLVGAVQAIVNPIAIR
jgi:kynurenine formamidase